MATITLYKDKLNGVGGLIDNIIKSSNSLDTQLGTLKSTLQGVSNSTYNLQDTVNNISSSSKTEKEKVSDLKKLNKQVTEFITTTVKTSITRYVTLIDEADTTMRTASVDMAYHKKHMTA